MSAIELTLRSLARSGRLNHLTLAFTSDNLWSATYRGVDDPDKRTVSHSDPVEALISALTGRKPPPIEVSKHQVTKSRKSAPAKPVAPPVDDFEGLL